MHKASTVSEYMDLGQPLPVTRQARAIGGRSARQGDRQGPRRYRGYGVGGLSKLFVPAGELVHKFQEQWS
jgi:hypothetical protein